MIKNSSHTERAKGKPARRGFVLIECEGEAHSNPYIDNCMMCAPRWGWREVKAEAELDRLRRIELAAADYLNTPGPAQAGRLAAALSEAARAEAEAAEDAIQGKPGGGL